MRTTTILTLALALLLGGAVQAATYTIDTSHSSVGFKVKHMMVSNVRGTFDSFEGTIEFDEADPAGWSVAAVIQMASVNTADEKRDAHLINPDFFDVENHPTMTFASTGVEKKGDGWILKGDLTLHGVTKPVELEMEYNGSIDDPWGNHRAGFTAEGKIDRRDFGITWNNTLDKGGLAVGNDVTISLEIEAIRQ